MFRISKSLNKCPDNILSLNLSYNSLNFKENPVDSFFNSEDFLEQFVEYLQTTTTLNHLDISGISFEKEQLKTICLILASISSLIAVHLTGMGIKRNEDDPDNDLMLEILDVFGIDKASVS